MEFLFCWLLSSHLMAGAVLNIRLISCWQWFSHFHRSVIFSSERNWAGESWRATQRRKALGKKGSVWFWTAYCVPLLVNCDSVAGQGHKDHSFLQTEIKTFYFITREWYPWDCCPSVKHFIYKSVSSLYFYCIFWSVFSMKMYIVNWRICDCLIYFRGNKSLLSFNTNLQFSAVDEDISIIELFLRTEDQQPISYNGKLPNFFFDSSMSVWKTHK